MVDNISPQDEGTGVSDGNADYNDAAQLAQLVHSPNSTNYVVDGLRFTPDPSSDTLTISKGVARIYIPELSTRDHTNDSLGPNYAARTLLECTQVVQKSAEPALDLISGTKNHIYLTIDNSVRDGGKFVVKESDTDPSAPSIKLGTVSLSGEVDYNETNRDPSATYEALNAASLNIDEGVQAKTVESQGNFVEQSVDEGDVLTVPEGKAMMVSGEYTVNGTLVVNGTITIV